MNNITKYGLVLEFIGLLILFIGTFWYIPMHEVAVVWHLWYVGEGVLYTGLAFIIVGLVNVLVGENK